MKLVSQTKIIYMHIVHVHVHVHVDEHVHTCIQKIYKYMYSVQYMSKNALFMLIHVHSVEFDTLLPVGGICMFHQEQRDSDSISHDHCAGERKEET